ncbi:hypothetical protein SAURM35S_08547 [Streptomyces aurantiogriseus]
MTVPVLGVPEHGAGQDGAFAAVAPTSFTPRFLALVYGPAPMKAGG